MYIYIYLFKGGPRHHQLKQQHGVKGQLARATRKSHYGNNRLGALFVPYRLAPPFRSIMARAYFRPAVDATIYRHLYISTAQELHGER